MKSHAKILKLIRNFVFSLEFLNASRVSEKHFTRKRSLPFPTLILFLINFLKGSLKDELDWFFMFLKQSQIPDQFVSKSALCQARQKLKPDTFRTLNKKFIDIAYEQQSNLLFWRSHRLIAADGSSILVPDVKAIIEHFGCSKNSVGTATPMAKVLALYDPLNGYVVDCEIGPFKSDERKQLYSMLDCLSPNDLLLLDRGFPAYWIFSAAISRQINFTCRLPVGKWKAARELISSGKKEQIITLKADSKNKKICRTFGIPTPPLNIRILQIPLDNSESEVLVTSLTDCHKYPYEEFKELYFKRWWIEEDFKLLKSRLKVEHFTGVTPLTVYQDIHAKLFAKNVAALLRSLPDQILGAEVPDRKYPYQTNRTQVISKLKNTIVSLFCVSFQKLEKLLSSLYFAFIETAEPIRKNRKYPRKRKKRTGFAVQYKPTR